MKSIVAKIFKRGTSHTGKVYAVTTGDYVGEMFVCVEETEETFKFLSIPKNINRYVPKEKFDFGMNYDIIEYVDTLPDEVFDVVKAQFIKNEDSHN